MKRVLRIGLNYGLALIVGNVGGAPPYQDDPEVVELSRVRTPWLCESVTAVAFEHADPESHFVIPDDLLCSSYVRAILAEALVGCVGSEVIAASAGEEIVIAELINAGAWYKAALRYSNCADFWTRVCGLPWRRLGACGVGAAVTATLAAMGRDHNSLLCGDRRPENCDTRMLVSTCWVVCASALTWIGCTLFNMHGNYGFCMRAGLAETADDLGWKKYYYIMSAVCAEQSAFRENCLPNDGHAKSIDFSDNVCLWRWREAYARWRAVARLEEDDRKKARYSDRAEAMEWMTHSRIVGENIEQLSAAAERFLALACHQEASNLERALDAYRAIVIVFGVHYCRCLWEQDSQKYLELCCWGEERARQAAHLLRSCDAQTAVPLRHRLGI